MKQKGLAREKINDISKDIWNKMEEKERNKIRDKLYYKKYEYKKNILTDKILKYFILNNIKLENENSIDVEFEKMKYKSRLSKQFKIVEKDFDYLQDEIINILSDIQYLNEKIEKDETELNEAELDDDMNKQKSFSNLIKLLLEEKITNNNAEEISEKKFKLDKEYLALSEKMKKYLKINEERIKLKEEIQLKKKKV